MLCAVCLLGSHFKTHGQTHSPLQFLLRVLNLKMLITIPSKRNYDSNSDEEDNVQSIGNHRYDRNGDPIYGYWEEQPAQFWCHKHFEPNECINRFLLIHQLGINL